MLETTAGVLRETMRVEGVMESKTSEGKAQVVVMGLCRSSSAARCRIIDPEWMQPLFHDPIGWAIIVFACFLEAVGMTLLVRKFTRIDV